MASEITTTVQTGDIKRIGRYVHGDICWIDYGGALLVTCEDDPDNMWLEVVVPLQYCDSSIQPPLWEIYQIDLDCRGDFDWADLPAVAQCVGYPLEDLQTSLNSDDPVERIGAVCAIGEYYGFSQLDPDYLELGVRDVRKRYPDEDPSFDCEHDPDMIEIKPRIAPVEAPDRVVVVFTCKNCDATGEFEIDPSDIDWD